MEIDSIMFLSLFLFDPVLLYFCNVQCVGHQIYLSLSIYVYVYKCVCFGEMMLIYLILPSVLLTIKI